MNIMISILIFIISYVLTWWFNFQSSCELGILIDIEFYTKFSIISIDLFLNFDSQITYDSNLHTHIRLKHKFIDYDSHQHILANRINAIASLTFYLGEKMQFDFIIFIIRFRFL